MINDYKFSSAIVSDEMKIKYFSLKNPHVDFKFPDKKFYKLAIYVNWDKDSDCYRRNFLKILHIIFSNKKDFKPFSNASEYLTEALADRTIYQKEINGEKYYFLTIEQRTDFEFFNKKTNKREIAKFPVPVYYKGEKFEQEKIPNLDDLNYENKAKVTYKVKTKISSNATYVDLVSVELTDFKEYISQPKISDEVPDFGNVVLDDKKDEDVFEEKHEINIFNDDEFDDDIPF